jgi:hypothetical protein
MIKLILILIVILFYITLLIIFNIFHNLYFNVNVVFYSSLADTLFCLVFVYLLLNFKKFQNQLLGTERSLILVICILLGYIYSLSIPTVIDRSLSLYLLEKIKQQEGQINYESLNDVISKDYLKEYKIVDVRITEQLESGTIILKDGCVLLTDKGYYIAITSEYIRKNFLPKHRLLNDTYTDILTNPVIAGEDFEKRKCQRK